VLLEHHAQRRHDGRQTLAARDELGVEQLFGRVVHHGDERLPGVGDQGQPRVQTAIEVHQLPETGARLAAAAMPAARAPLADQAGGLQRLLHEAVRQPHAMVAARHLVEVPDVEARVAVAWAVALPVQAQEALDLAQRDRPG
jgi:hypothetical protein